MTFVCTNQIGIDGLKIKVYGTSMDTPGRADLLGMQACTSYTPCCVCEHCFSPGIGAATQCVFDGYRRYLNPRSRGRRRRVVFDGILYEYYQAESRPKPRVRNDETVRLGVAFARQRDAPFLGHKSLPMMSLWPGFAWYRMNIPDVMHGGCLTTLSHTPTHNTLSHTHSQIRRYSLK